MRREMADMRKKGFPVGMPERISQEIEKSGLSCPEIGRRIDRDRKAIYAWKNGETCPSALDVLRLSAVLGTTPNYLIMGRN